MSLGSSLLPRSVETRPFEPNEDVIHLSSRAERQFLLPPEGLVLPARIELPLVTASVPTIRQAAVQLGMNLPQSLSRQMMINRMESILIDTLGYHRDGQSLTRQRPVRVTTDEVAPSIQRTTPINLPKLVNAATFSTKESLLTFINQNNLQPYIRSGQGRLKGDLRQFLAEHNYAINPNGDFIRETRLQIEGGLEYQDSIRSEHYYEFLMRTQAVPITQDDLIKLQMTMQEIVPLLPRRRWSSFNEFVNDVSVLLGIDTGVAQLIVLLSRIGYLTPGEIQGILTQIQDTNVYKNNSQRTNALLGYMRTRLQVIPKHYPEGKLQDREAPEGTSLDEIIQGGYTFDPMDFRAEISPSRHLLAPSQVRFLGQLYRKYPGVYEMSKKFVQNKTTLTSRIIELYYGEEPTYSQEIYTFTINYPIFIPESEEKKNRRAQLNALPGRYMRSIYGIYRIRDIEEILDTPQHPLELYVLALPKIRAEQLAEIVRNAGMLVPEHLTRSEIRDYVIDHIHMYKDVLSRPEGTPEINQVFKNQPESFREFRQRLLPYGDFEIIDFFGYNGGFDNRDALIDNIYRTIIDEGFMIFNEVDKERATNTETLMLTQIGDLQKPYLVFGTPFQYRVLELDELIQAFSGGLFRKIGGERNETYTIPQIGRLQILLPTMKNQNPQMTTSVEQILQLVNSGILGSLRRNEQVDRFIREVNRLGTDEKDLVKRIFYQVFYSGMYMRRWRGPGNRYPVTGSETRSNIDPQPKVVLALGDLYNMLQQAPRSLEFDSLFEVDYNPGDNGISFTNSELFPFIKIVSMDKYCIRKASKRLVNSAHYYIGVIFGEAVPDFSPFDVESIS